MIFALSHAAIMNYPKFSGLKQLKCIILTVLEMESKMDVSWVAFFLEAPGRIHFLTCRPSGGGPLSLAHGLLPSLSQANLGQAFLTGHPSDITLCFPLPQSRTLLVTQSTLTLRSQVVKVS